MSREENSADDAKIAVVTGGTRGIGLEITRGLLADGHRVAAIYYGNDERAARCAQEMGIACLKADVSDFASCEAAVREIESRFGRVDILVNNAGITKDGMLHKMPLESWRDVIETNLSSCFNMCRLVIEGMRTRNYGRIVSISSINGQKGQLGQVNYAAAKAGILGFTKALALESAAKGITVNAVCPGYVETEMTAGMNPEVLGSIVRQIPVGRLGRPGEIADIVSFLASDRAGYITGATITANGGQYMV